MRSRYSGLKFHKKQPVAPADAYNPAARQNHNSADPLEMQAPIAQLKADIEQLRAQSHLDLAVQQHLLNSVVPALKESAVTEAFRAAGDFLQHMMHMNSQTVSAIGTRQDMHETVM
ncbi:hypothetical protein C8F01DRAFT_1257775 [Mycena amicta]|nr:hypothetical protein C8F01DRAFT_1257775 [Mycena amicta]